LNIYSEMYKINNRFLYENKYIDKSLFLSLLQENYNKEKVQKGEGSGNYDIWKCM